MDKDTGETTKQPQGGTVDKTLDNKWNGVKGL